MPEEQVRIEERAEVLGAAIAPEMSRFIGFLVRRVYAQLAAATAEGDSRPRDHAVLAVLADGNAFSQVELAERLGINRTIMIGVLDRLEAAGWVVRVRLPGNRRAHMLSVTDAGRAQLETLRAEVRNLDEALTPSLSDAERRRLNELVHKLLPEPERTPQEVGTQFLIAQVHHLLRKRGDAMLANSGLRVRHYGPLTAIRIFGPCPQQRLANYLAITEPATAQLVEELVQSGLVLRGQDPSDRRRSALLLTERGYERLAEVSEAVERLQAGIVDILGVEGEAELRSLLIRLLSAMPAAEGISVS